MEFWDPAPFYPNPLVVPNMSAPHGHTGIRVGELLENPGEFPLGYRVGAALLESIVIIPTSDKVDPQPPVHGRDAR